jgi:hypothetical protein
VRARLRRQPSRRRGLRQLQLELARALQDLPATHYRDASMANPSDTERIDGWDDHLYWIVSFSEKKVWCWMEHSDDDWSTTECPIRRQNGRWEMFLDEVKWTELLEAKRALKARSPLGAFQRQLDVSEAQRCAPTRLGGN